MSEESKLYESMERLGATALGWREKAERYETALMLIAANKGKTLISVEHGQSYSIGANAAFENCAAVANAALSPAAALAALAQAGGDASPLPPEGDGA